MLIGLHKNATTTPATRQALQQASGTDRELAQQYGIGVDTVRKWRRRTSVHDAMSYGTPLADYAQCNARRVGHLSAHAITATAR